MNGPSGTGIAGRGAYSPKVQAGDIVIIPTGVAHGWSQITDHVTYLGYVLIPIECAGRLGLSELC